MQASTRAFIKRGGAACAAAAVLLGGSFTVATAAPSSDPTIAPAVASVTAEATPTSTSSTTSSTAPLPEGLAEAVDRDLNLSVEEFNAQGELAAKAAQVQTEVVKADPNAQVSIAGDTINVKTSTTAAAAAKAAAGSAKVSVITAPAASPSAKVDAANVDALFAAYVAEFGTAQLQSIMVNGNGDFVIRTGEAATGGPALKTRSFTAAAKPSVNDFAAKYGNVKVEAAAGPATAYATDVTNGQGYLGANEDFTNGGSCSIGWNGFNKDGAPAIISAGHCTLDGALTHTFLTNPQQEPAVTGDPDTGEILGPLGIFGASQFGGPNNSPISDAQTNPGNIGTDVSVIDDINPDLNQIALVTDWATPTDLGASGVKVSGVSTAIVGAPICKSGRTTGWTCGTVDEVGFFAVGGFPNQSDPADARAVRGFGSTTMKSDHGDSGGPVISANTAVGITSAGTADGIWSFTADLTTALNATDGYTVKIFLEAPAVTTTAPVYREGAVTGTVAGAPAGTTVTVTIDGNEDDKVDVPVDADGKWTAKAPNKFGTFAVTVQAKNGFSTSETAEASVEVIKETLAAPAITSPANNANVAAPATTIGGTGKAGATVELTGDVSGTVVVGNDGKWSFAIEPGLEVGPYTVTAKQTLTDWNDSTNTTSKFTVVPAAPAITTPSNGQEFAFDQGPTAISGTNIAGATLTVTMNGKAQKATVVDGTWSVALDAKLVTGKYAVTAVQTIDGVDSLTTTSAFTVLAEPKPEPTTPPAPAPTTAPATAPTTAPATAPTKAPSNGDLANTGAPSSMLILGGAGGLLLLAGSAFLLIRRRNNAS